jgi:hypothetical protein
VDLLAITIIITHFSFLENLQEREREKKSERKPIHFGDTPSIHPSKTHQNQIVYTPPKTTIE